jgi:hypothetical protein
MCDDSQWAQCRRSARVCVKNKGAKRRGSIQLKRYIRINNAGELNESTTRLLIRTAGRYEIILTVHNITITPSPA